MCADLLDETLRLAREAMRTRTRAGERRQSMAAICRAARVSERWYYRLLQGDFRDPGVRRVQRLHDALVSAGEQSSASQ